MKVIIYGWDEGMKKLPLSNYLVENFGFRRSDAIVYNLFKSPPKEICFEIDFESREDVERNLKDFRVKYKILDNL